MRYGTLSAASSPETSYRSPWASPRAYLVVVDTRGSGRDTPERPRAELLDDPRRGGVLPVGGDQHAPEAHPFERVGNDRAGGLCGESQSPQGRVEGVDELGLAHALDHEEAAEADQTVRVPSPQAEQAHAPGGEVALAAPDHRPRLPEGDRIAVEQVVPNGRLVAQASEHRRLAGPESPQVEAPGLERGGGSRRGLVSDHRGFLTRRGAARGRGRRRR